MFSLVLLCVFSVKYLIKKEGVTKTKKENYIRIKVTVISKENTKPKQFPNSSKVTVLYKCIIGGKPPKTNNREEKYKIILHAYYQLKIQLLSCKDYNVHI